MPTFDFQCQECSYIFEHARPFGSTEIPPCPQCACNDVEKLVATPAIHFKGEGFYKTDSAPKESKAKEEKPSKPEAKSEKSASAKPEKDSKKEEK